MKVKKFGCPACGAKTRVTGSHMEHKGLRVQYIQCTNPHCSGSYKLATEISAVTSPTSDLFRAGVKFIGGAVAQPDISEIASEFVRRHKIRDYERDPQLYGASFGLAEEIKAIALQCADYLRGLYPDANASLLVYLSFEAVMRELAQLLPQWQRPAVSEASA